MTLGVTGHRDLRPEEIRPLQDRVRSKLKELQGEYRHTPLRLLCSLSSGADLLCAGIALEEELSLLCALPLPLEEYKKDFEGEDLARFEQVIAQADAVFRVPAAEPLPQDPGRDFWYRQAGIFVAGHCQVLLALWDGTPGRGSGCGTFEAIGFMRQGTGGFRAEPGGAVFHVHTGRQSNDIRSDSSLRLLEDKPGTLEEALRLTDLFNGEGLPSAQGRPLAPPDVLARSGPLCEQLHRLYLRADVLSGWYRDKYLGIMKALAVFSALMVICFLLYDELAASLFLPFYGVFLLLSALFLTLSRRKGYHTRYLQYRVAAEALRVQFFLSAAGIRHNIASSFTWTQKQDSAWVTGALSSLLSLPTSSRLTLDEMKRYWISQQLVYHEAALKSGAGKLRISKRAANAMLALSIGLFFAAVFLEFLGKPLMAMTIPTDALRPWLMMREGERFTFSALIKVFLGSASAVTLFLSSYYGRLSLERKRADHQKMASLYRKALAYCGTGACGAEQLFLKIAQEEIIECGNWFSYCLDNPLNMNL